MEPIRERRRHAEVPTPTSYSPEQVCILPGTGSEQATIGCDDFNRQQVIARGSVLSRQPAQTAAQREASDAGRGTSTQGSGQTEGLRRFIKVIYHQTRFSTCDAPFGIDLNPFHA